MSIELRSKESALALARFAELKGRPTVQADDQKVEISKSLREFCEWMEKTDRKLPSDEVRDLATMRSKTRIPSRPRHA